MEGQRLSGKTQLAGLIGWPVSHSLSPAMHNAAMAALELDWVYVPMPVHRDDVAAAVRGLAALGFGGANITVPHKQAILPLLDDIDEAAAAIGAVNTIVFERKPGTKTRLIGYNTDWTGFGADLQALGVHVSGRDCLVLGAGGSARAVVYALAAAGGRVHVLARRSAQAEQVVSDLAKRLAGTAPAGYSLSDLAAVTRQCSAPLIVNTTPLGMTPHVEVSPWPDDLPLPSGAFVYDLIYNPAVTRLMQQAQAEGCQTANGLGMLVRQGAAALALWTGQAPDITVMTAAVSRMNHE